MQRDLMKALQQWKSDPIRMPLILRGARQVGKSWLIDAFAKSFPSYTSINFDEDENASSFFEGHLDIEKILQKLRLYTNTPLIPGESLLFLDEIQECPQAVKSLRYFKEKCPQLHVVAAGSLLDFLLEKIGVPVGRVQFMYLYPLSFGEFLTSMGQQALRESIFSGETSTAIHNLLLAHLKDYMWLGGMPAVIDTWLRFKDPAQCLSMQERIITAYRQDFLKYARKNQITHVENVFFSIATQLGNKFKYQQVAPSQKSASLKNALSLLIKAGIAYPCYHASAQGLPLLASHHQNRFKVFFFDIGLAQRINQLSLKEWVTAPMDVGYLGAIAEQWVAQEYIAYSSVECPPALYYWHKEDKRSNAEVDFLFAKNNHVIPVEVKAGVKGGMKSMHVFLKTHPSSPYGLKISQHPPVPFSSTCTLHHLPLYGLEAWMKGNSPASPQKPAS